MSNLTANEARGLLEAYNAVYAPQTADELTLDIIENASYVLFSQGYDVNDVISYFTKAETDIIVEDFVNFSEGHVLIESVSVSDEYIEEQFELLNEILGKLVQGAVKLGSKIFGAGAGAMKGGAGAKGALGAMAKSAGRSATQTLAKAGTAAKGLMSKAAGVVSKIPGAAAAGKLVGRAAPGVGAALYGADAISRAKKGDWGGAALSGLGAGLSLAPGVGAIGALAPAAVQMGTDALGLTGNKSKGGAAVKTAPSAKYNASKALGGQTAFKAGGGMAAMKKNPSLSAADVQKAGSQALFKAGGGTAATQGKTRAQVIAQGVKATAGKGAKPAVTPSVSGSTGTGGTVKTAPAKPAAKPATGMLGKTSYERRTPTSAELKGAQEYRQQNPNAKPEDVLKAAQLRGKQQASVDADLKKANSPEELNKPAPAGTALAAEQERRRKKAQETAAAGTANESYDAYDIVLEYLVSGGHVESISEAHYVMLEMDAETIKNIVEAQYARENPERHEHEERSRETRGQSAERRVRDRLRTMDPEKAAKMKAQMRAVGLNV